MHTRNPPCLWRISMGGSDVLLVSPVLWSVYDPVRLLAGICCCNTALFTFGHSCYLLTVLSDDLDVLEYRLQQERDASLGTMCFFFDHGGGCTSCESS